MTATTNNTTELILQKRGNHCITAQRKIIKIFLIYVIVLTVCIGMTAGIYYVTRPTIMSHPDFEPGVASGAPEVEKEYAYSTLTVSDDYIIKLCGVPKLDGKMLHLNLTNPKGNYVWFRAEVLNADGDIIGSTGVIKTNEYMPAIELAQAIGKDDKVTVRIVGYMPYTWHSAGNVNLKINSFYSGDKAS